jgi:hypothetical protein
MAAAALFHEGSHGPNGIVVAAQVDVDDFSPPGWIKFLDGARMRMAALHTR